MQQEKISVEALLAAGTPVQIHVPTNSMYQFIRPNRDEAIIEPVEDAEKLRRGDVALYRRDGSILVLHRVWKVKDGAYYMLGDNQAKAEGPIRPDQIRGVLAGIVRDGKTIRVTDPGYVLLSHLWLLMRPLRPIVWRLHRLIRR